MKYSKKISESEAKFSINIESRKVVRKGGGQASYNLPKDFFTEATIKKIIIEDLEIDHYRKEKDGNAYVLSEEYKLRLGKGIINIIGEKYLKRNNKFIGTLPSNNKFQLHRVVYENLNSDGYGWFVDLYDSNITGNILILVLDEKNKELNLDIEPNRLLELIKKNDINTGGKNDI